MANNSFLKFASSMNSNTEKDKATYQGNYNADKFGTPTAPSTPATNPNSPVNYEGGTAAYYADKFGTPSGGFQGIANNFSSGLSSYVESGTTMGAATPTSGAPAANPNSPDNYDGGREAYLADKFGETPAAGGTEAGTNGAPTEGEIPPQGELSPEGTPSEPTDTDMGTVTDGAVTGEAIAGGETVTESGEVIDPVEVEIQSEVDATIDTGKLTFDEWKATYGADTETDFQNAKAQLEYEMATWAANYGANAEKLYQMGLSNSGVSDIFGANAYAAYVGAMNQLYLEKIKLDRQNIELYDKYVNKYEADKAAATETRNKNITNAYVYGLGIYDGENLDAVKTMMQNAGYEADVVEEAAARLAAVDPSMIPTLRKQQETSDTKVSTVYNGYKRSYHPGMKETIEADLTAQNFSAEEIARVIGQLDDYYNSLPEEQRPDVVAANAEKTAKEETDKAKIVEGYNAVLTQGIYNGNNSDAVYQQLINLEYTEEQAQEIIRRLESLDKSIFTDKEVLKAYQILAENIPNFTGSKEQKDFFVDLMNENKIPEGEARARAWRLALSGMKANGAEANGAESTTSDTITAGARAVVDALFTDIPYEGKGVQKEQIRQALRGTKFESQTEQIIAQMDEEYNALKEASVADIVAELDELEVGSSAISEYSARLSQARSAYGKDSKEYKQVLAKVSEKVVSTMKWALETNANGTAKRLLDPEVWEILGIDASELEGIKKDSEKAAHIEDAILKKAAVMRERGEISAEAYMDFVKNNWMDSELQTYIDDDNEDWQATGLNGAGAVVEDLMEWHANGALSDEEYDELLNYAIDKMQFKVSVKGRLNLNGTITGTEAGEISWYGTVKGSEATYSWLPAVSPSKAITGDLKDTLSKIAKENNQTYAVYNGKIYITDDLGWLEMTPSNLQIRGDGISANDQMKDGIYEILVALLSK